MSDQISTIEELADRLDGERVAMVSTVDERGTLSSRPVAIQEITNDGDIWFLVSSDADWVMPANGGPVNASVVDDRTWVSFAGRVELSSSPERIAELMDGVSDAFFEDTSETIALRVVTDRVEWWAAPNKAAQIFELAKAKVTNTTPDMGSSGSIET